MKRKEKTQNQDRKKKSRPERSSYKQIQLVRIPVKWSVKKFSEVFSFLGSEPIPRELLTIANNSSNIYCIHYGDIHATYDKEILDFELESNRVPVLRSKDMLPAKPDYLKDGDLVIADASEDYEGVAEAIELRNLKARKVLGGLHTIVARDTTGQTVPGYRCYVLRHPIVRKSVMRAANGLSVFGISKSNLAKINIPLPPVSEQRSIALILETWDEAAVKLEVLIAQKELRRKALMQQLLTGKKRLRGFNSRWKEVHLGEMFDERNQVGRADLPLLSITADRGVILQSESIKRDNSTEDKSRYKRIAVGDIGYNTMRMWQGRSALSPMEGIVSPAYTVVVPRENADGKFFSYLFKLPRVIHLFFRNSQGLVEDTLNCKYPDFAVVKVHVPEKKEQIAIAAVLSSCDEEIELLKNKLDALKEQKKGLMQKLLTGQIRVNKAS